MGYEQNWKKLKYILKQDRNREEWIRMEKIGQKWIGRKGMGLDRRGWDGIGWDRIGWNRMSKKWNKMKLERDQ